MTTLYADGKPVLTVDDFDQDYTGYKELLEYGIVTPNEFRDRLLNKKEPADTNCRNCGAPFNYRGYSKTYTCPYCGTTYTLDAQDTSNVLIMERPGVKVMQVSMKIPDYRLCYMGEKDIARIVTKQLANELAQKIMEDVVIESCDDLCSMERTFRARIRVLDKNFAF